MKTILQLLLIIPLIYTLQLSAQSGSLDMSFGTNGKVITPLLPGSYDEGIDIGYQPDGKYIAKCFLSNENFMFLSRYNLDGSIDTTFGTNGKTQVSYPDYYYNRYSMLVDTNGKILILSRNRLENGEYHFAVKQYTPDGMIDSTFASNGLLSFDIGTNGSTGTVLKPTPDNKYVVAGTTNTGGEYFAVKFNPDGTVDSTYGTNGVIFLEMSTSEEPDFYNIGIMQDGRLLFAGSFTNYYQEDIFCIMMKTDGTIDSTFGINGRLNLDFIETTESGINILPLPDDKFIIACNVRTTLSDIGVAKFDQNGTPVSSFGNQGKEVIDVNGNEEVDYLKNLQLQSDGKIILLCYTYYAYTYMYDYAVLTLNPDGSRDPEFGINGLVRVDFNHNSDEPSDFVIQPDHRITVIGETQNNAQYDIGLCRILTTLYLKNEDFSQSNANLLIYPNPVYGICTVKSELFSYEKPEIIIYDANGRMIRNPGDIKLNPANKSIEFDSEVLKPGIYVMDISTSKGHASVKIIKN